jgi:predicted RNase H-like nuclease (RuvC/YqgF family)
MPACSVCCEDFGRGESYAVCSAKDCTLHWPCSGITEKSWQSMSVPNRSKWRCPNCRKSKTEGGTQEVTADELRRFMSTVTSKLSELTNLVPLVEDLERSVQVMSDKYDEVMDKLKKSDEEMKKQNKTMREVQANLKESEKEVKVLKEKISFMEQVARNKNIEISGVPVMEGERLDNVINRLAVKFNVSSSVTDVDVMHRIPARNGIPKIVVQFKTRQVRDKWVSARKQAEVKSSDIVEVSGPPVPVYINEQLTPYMKELLWKTKQEARQKGYHMVWFKNNKILVKKSFNDKSVLRIVCEEDLSKLPPTSA